MEGGVPSGIWRATMRSLTDGLESRNRMLCSSTVVDCSVDERVFVFVFEGCTFSFQRRVAFGKENIKHSAKENFLMPF